MQWYEPMKTKFSGYHGYWPISSSKVDFRFGTNDEFKKLVADGHIKDMNVLLDYVAHHVHNEHPFYNSIPSGQLRFICPMVRRITNAGTTSASTTRSTLLCPHSIYQIQK